MIYKKLHLRKADKGNCIAVPASDALLMSSLDIPFDESRSQARTVELKGTFGQGASQSGAKLGKSSTGFESGVGEAISQLLVFHTLIIIRP